MSTKTVLHIQYLLLMSKGLIQRIPKPMSKSPWKMFHLLKQRSERTFLITWPLVLVIAFLVFMTLQSMQILSACRAYVGGEGLWSKGQKDAVYSLIQYAQSHNRAY